ncbi:MAG TPA: hypothetical protein DD727_04695 [Clostridiales bacterium]|nr:hypothetical protein [Clostridiales bacterium]
MSQYLGDLKTYESFLEYVHTISHLKGLLQTGQVLVAHDLNSDLLSSQYAPQAEKRIVVQHHHAHMASCILEHRLNQDVIGIIYDGTGLGTDGAAWGGEIFTGNTKEYTRIAHWKNITLQGGDLAVQQPWRCAACYLHAAGINACRVLKNIDEKRMTAVHNALEEGILCCKSSSMGRLFDAAAAILNVRDEITYDAQAAIELEAIADPTTPDCYSYTIKIEDEKLTLCHDGIIRGIVEDMESGVEKSRISAKFHNTIIAATAHCVERIRDKTGISQIVLSGGVFENQFILLGLIRELSATGFKVYHNQRIPINDGGVSFGQAAVAAAILEDM